MHLSSQAIIIITVVFGGSFLLMIPFLIFNNKRKNKQALFIENNKDKAILHLYADNPVIDGIKIKETNYIKGADLQYIAALAPGTHTISAKYTASSVGLGTNVNYKTPEAITSEITLQAGHEYTLSVYFYSPEDRKAYYKGDVGEDVYTQVLDITGVLPTYTKAYIICYKEK
ncbi:branched-subunit amino acid transport protein AzlD [Elusimicrobium posterum]|uniref:hypothetical protein n=1 Tax=Elusimicrobium posterum TaxID=3116653 RepID=UPI003C76E692